MRRLLLLAAPLLFSAELLIGPAGLDWGIVDAVRLPRALGAAVSGALLGMSGLLLQTSLRNPLADPYLLGVSGSAMLTALGSYLLWRLWGLPYLGYFLGAVAGAALAVAGLTALARRASLYVVLMAGVLAAFLTGAALQLALLLLPPEELGYIYLGLQGSYGAYPPGALGWAVAGAAALLLAAVYLNSRHISALVHGEEAAAGLGVDVRRASALAVAAASAGAGLAVASVGPVGFVGLLAPHMARWAAGSHRVDRVLFDAAAMGAVLSLGADLAMRLLLPRDVPANVVLSIVGAPAAALLMWRYVRRV
ncbi:iron chelate uptake ABC transporter family permease subunit [Pyrobaculum neutrophilum]|uniref:Transport system permease protein n=1 Tax=Pyrobaculum neutrophilum (strain DSM 2338 / JCM 9278 / NBRC 100436 / V24Sta) TaxID=444157 RepID=B1YE10_PYRNV|nr:iron chelate uptake ABC transporter family permease subunit [Pyrobaculum neutrophilum]ACB40023.1 transport system permease protein [Pyrobaculum neutrophilum V24Sta]